MVFMEQAMTFAILEIKAPYPFPVEQVKAMRSYEYKHGLSLVEILVAVSVIAILTTIVIGIAARIDNQSKERSLKGTFALLESALQEYYEYWDAFPDPNQTPYPSHSAALYGQLKSTPGLQKILDELNSSLIQNHPDAVDMPQINDPWGVALDYRYVLSDNFPRLVSAGPDKTLGNADDITNR